MNFKELLYLSECGKNFWKKINRNIKNNCVYLYIPKINELLSTLNSSQSKILKSNYKGIKKTNQLSDKLSEILVAYEFIKEQPIFFDDNMGKPDIWLKRKDEYIEVKRLNCSDIQREVLEKINNNGGVDIKKTKFNSMVVKKMNGGLSNKAKYHIDKAIKQLSKTSEHGIIYFIYSIDIIFCPHSNREVAEEKFIESAKEYFKLKKNNNISFRMMNETKLFR